MVRESEADSASNAGSDINSASAGSGNQKEFTSSPKSLPSLSLPKGGGAIRGIDEKFAVNPSTGTGTISVPVFGDG